MDFICWHAVYLIPLTSIIHKYGISCSILLLLAKSRRMGCCMEFPENWNIVFGGSEEVHETQGVNRLNIFGKAETCAIHRVGPSQGQRSSKQSLRVKTLTSPGTARRCLRLVQLPLSHAKSSKDAASERGHPYRFTGNSIAFESALFLLRPLAPHSCACKCSQ